jgi:hypothetical protein
MDGERFDHLTKARAPTDTRRRLLRLLAVLPIGAALLARIGAEIASADPGDPEHGSSHRRHRRKARHDPGKDKKHRKGKRKGKRKEKKSTGSAPSAPAQLPPTLPPTRKVVTQTFTNASPIAIPTVGPANPYPSTLAVSGLPNGTITTIKVLLTGYSHTFPDDVDILLVAPTGTDALIMSDVGGDTNVNAIDLVLDDAATAPLPNFNFSLSSGSFQPANYRGNDQDVDTFPAPAPAATGTPLRTFAGQNPNGTWQLFVRDDLLGDVGSLASWGLEITAEVDA